MPMHVLRLMLLVAGYVSAYQLLKLLIRIYAYRDYKRQLAALQDHLRENGHQGVKLTIVE